tara:strand:+ start:745 stop:993 length:249 start_codon:yes stop_codon:yes gene_type:complete
VFHQLGLGGIKRFALQDRSPRVVAVEPPRLERRDMAELAGCLDRVDLGGRDLGNPDFGRRGLAHQVHGIGQARADGLGGRWI